MLTEFLLKSFLSLKLQLFISIFSLSLYLINKNLLKARFLTRFRINELVLFSLPYFNICFMVLNLCVFYMKFYVFAGIMIKPFKRYMRFYRKTSKSFKKAYRNRKVFKSNKANA